ncbi:MAG: hypothetical protein AB1635_01560 [Acidobacteriota bacterium]
MTKTSKDDSGKEKEPAGNGTASGPSYRYTIYGVPDGFWEIEVGQRQVLLSSNITPGVAAFVPIGLGTTAEAVAGAVTIVPDLLFECVPTTVEPTEQPESGSGSKESKGSLD